MNWMSGNRTISIQEAVHEIEELPLILCSERIIPLFINKYMTLRRKSDEKSNDCITQYANRTNNMEMGLARYFYLIYIPSTDKSTIESKDYKKPILNALGMNYRPTHPITFEYARGLLILYKPWSKQHYLDLRDRESVIETATEMIFTSKVPWNVISEYYRAINKKKQIDLVSKQRRDDIDEQPKEGDDPDYIEQQIYSNHASRITRGTLISPDIGGTTVDIGLNHNWSIPFFKGERQTTVPGETYIQWAKDKAFANAQNSSNTDDILEIPKKKGMKYKLENLSTEQRIVALAVIETVWKFVTSADDYKPLRATVMGSGGTGKSYLINTIVTVIREWTGCNGSVSVNAPSGGAAYNIGGCTLHRTLGINLHYPWKDLGEETKQRLEQTLKRLLVLIVDERSQLSSCVTGAAERIVRKCAFSGHNQSELWGGIPVILLVGDDYQLPPVRAEGAIIGYARKNEKTTYNNSSNGEKQILTEEGKIQLTEVLTETVFELTIPFRQQDVKSNADSYVQLLNRLRTSDSTDEDIKQIARLHWSRIPSQDKFKSTIENSPTTTYLYAHTNDKDAKNNMMLISTSRNNQTPVAKLHYHTIKSPRINTTPTKNDTGPKSKQTSTTWRRSTTYKMFASHYGRINQITTQTNLCVGCKVAINNINHEPSWGLFNGATGTVIDIRYDNELGPHSLQEDRLPKYVVVDMPGFQPPPEIGPWDKLNPTVS